MQVDIHLSSRELEPWRERIHRQLDFKIATLSDLVSRLEVSLERQFEGTSPLFTCNMQAHMPDGRIKVARTGGEYPNVCIADAAARLARSVGREVRLGTAVASRRAG